MKHMTHRAWITVDGQILPEYMVSKDGNTASCFIPSEAGKQFVIHWRDDNSGFFTASFINLDGNKFPGKYMNGSGEAQRSGVRVSEHSERPFMFQKIVLGPDAVPDKHDASQEVGIIEVKILKGERGSQQASAPFQPLPGAPLGPEYAFATGGHAVAFGKETPCHPRMDMTWGVKFKNPEDGMRSYLKFKFRYRPMMWLIAHSVVTLPPPPPRVAAPVGAPPGQGLLMNSRAAPVTTVENSPSPPGMMLAPSRSKKTSQSKKGKEAEAPAPTAGGSGSGSIRDLQNKYFGAAGQFSEEELARQHGSWSQATPHGVASSSQQPLYLPQASGYAQSPPSMIIDTSRFMGMGSPSLSSDGSGPSLSEAPSTPQPTFWEIPIQVRNSNEQTPGMNFSSFISTYPGEEDITDIVFGVKGKY